MCSVGTSPAGSPNLHCRRIRFTRSVSRSGNTGPPLTHCRLEIGLSKILLSNWARQDRRSNRNGVLTVACAVARWGDHPIVREPEFSSFTPNHLLRNTNRAKDSIIHFGFEHLHL